jgi:hypothetical protein
MAALIHLAWLLLAAPTWTYHSASHDLVVYADGHAIYSSWRSEKKLLEGHVASFLSKDELSVFEKSAQPKSGLRLCKVAEVSLSRGDQWIYFCIRQPIRPPAVARLLARLEKYLPPRAKRWTPARYHVYFAPQARLPSTLPRPTIGYNEVLVEANLLPEVKRFAKADPAAHVSWSPALPGVDDL